MPTYSSQQFLNIWTHRDFIDCELQCLHESIKIATDREFGQWNFDSQKLQILRPNCDLLRPTVAASRLWHFKLNTNRVQPNETVKIAILVKFKHQLELYQIATQLLKLYSFMNNFCQLNVYSRYHRFGLICIHISFSSRNILPMVLVYSFPYIHRHLACYYCW